jgi:release factor glutamine methyltransferase
MQLIPQLALVSLPKEVTGSGLRAKRGWRWWISRRILWLLFVLFGRRKCERLVLERIRGIPVVVFPGVFHPGLFFSTTLLFDAFDQLPLRPSFCVLDLGTGTGICAIFLAMKGAHVTATDISPLAVRCARVNVALNFMEDRVKVLEGDLFLPVEGERFDLVVFNPPYYEGRPKDWSEYAWRGERVLHRFVQGLAAHLDRGGRALVSVSTELNLSAIRQELHENGFEVHERCRRRIPGETIFVYECVPSSAGELVRSEELGKGQQ